MVGFNREEITEWVRNIPSEYVHPAQDSLVHFAKSGMGRTALIGSAITFFGCMYAQKAADTKTHLNAISAITETAKDYPTSQLRGAIVPFKKSHMIGRDTTEWMTLSVFPQHDTATVVGLVMNDSGHIVEIYPTSVPLKSELSASPEPEPRIPSIPRRIAGDSKSVRELII